MWRVLKYLTFIALLGWMLFGCSNNDQNEHKEYWQKVISNAYTIYIRQSDLLMRKYIIEHTKLLDNRTLTELLEALQHEYLERSKGKVDNFLVTVTCQAVGMSILEARYPEFSKTILKTKNINDTMRNICYYNDESSKEAIYNMLDAAYVFE